MCVFREGSVLGPLRYKLLANVLCEVISHSRYLAVLMTLRFLELLNYPVIISCYHKILIRQIIGLQLLCGVDVDKFM
jgi:hypothetical protein